MATASPQQAPAGEHPQGAERAGPTAVAADKALVPSIIAADDAGLIALSPQFAQLPVELDVSVPVHEFRVHNLLTLEPGQVVETQWTHGEDMPLAAGDVQLAWSEFEVVDLQLAVRITRLT
jgi:flagellar motor switch/type III secretory pathway protein FliN